MVCKVVREKREGMLFVGEDYLGGLVAADQEEGPLEGHDIVMVVEEEMEEDDGRINGTKNPIVEPISTSFHQMNTRSRFGSINMND